MAYYGDYLKGTTVYIPFNSNGGDGASITLATNGTPKAYVNGGTTEITTGVSLVEDHDAITGRHFISVDTSGRGFTAGSDVDVAIDANTVDGKTVNAWVGKFSILRAKYETPVVGLAVAATSTTVTLPATAVATNDYYNGSVITIAYGTGAGQSRVITDYASTKVATVEGWTTTPDTTSVVMVTAVAPAAAADLDAISNAVNEGAWDVFKTVKRTGTNGNTGLSATLPTTGAVTTTLDTDVAALPIIEVDTAS